MAVVELWDMLSAARRAYSLLLSKVEEKHALSRAELDVLLFLANNPEHNTAVDICRYRQLAKSHVSAAVNSLCTRGYLEKHWKAGNRKTVYLDLTPSALPAINDGKAAQAFFKHLTSDCLTEEEKRVIKTCFEKSYQSIREMLSKEGSNHVD